MPGRSRPTPKPWPMKWVAAAIVVFIAGYTVIELRFRKSGRPHEPARELRDREAAARLQQAGWVRMPVELQRPVQKLAFGDASVGRGAAGLGPDLAGCFSEKPLLFKSIDKVTAPAFVLHGDNCVVNFTASIPDLNTQLGDAQLLQRGNDLVLVPTVEHLPGKELYSRWDDANYSASFSTQNLPKGRYRMRLLAGGPAAQWTLDVR
jgi:hypothetical protein